MIEQILGNSSPIYPLWAFTMVALSLLLVRRKEYRFLLPHGMLGAIITGVFLFIASNIVKAWMYIEVEPFSISGISVFILIAWFATIIIFLWALPESSPTYVHYINIAIYAIVGAVLDQIFHELGLRPHATWYQPWMWFFVVYLIFWINYKIYLLHKGMVS